MAAAPSSALVLVELGVLNLLLAILEKPLPPGEQGIALLEDTLAVLVHLAKHDASRQAVAAGVTDAEAVDGPDAHAAHRLVAALLKLLANNGHLDSLSHDAEASCVTADELFVIEQAVLLLTELAASDEVSHIVASLPGLGCVEHASRTHFGTPGLLFAVFRLVFQLTFVHVNIEVIMKSTIVQLILSVIDDPTHCKAATLMLTAMSTLGNMAVTDPACVQRLAKVRHTLSAKSVQSSALAAVAPCCNSCDHCL